MYFVYILSNWDDSVLYIGVTGNLPRRLYEHRNGLVDSFTKKYNVHKLVYYEYTNDVCSAISREKQLKKWTRAKKNALIANMNPQWIDLSAEWDQPTFPITKCEDPSTSLRSAQDDSVLERIIIFRRNIYLWKFATKSIGAAI